HTPRPCDGGAAPRLLHRHGPAPRRRRRSRQMSRTIHAFHLPGIAESDIARWTVRDYGNGRVQLRVPVLEPELLERVVARLRGAGPWLREQPVARIVDAIDAVAERLADPADHARRTLEEALPELTGYSPPMIRLIL